MIYVDNCDLNREKFFVQTYLTTDFNLVIGILTVLLSLFKPISFIILNSLHENNN